MDFSREALETARLRLTHVRQRMADWGSGGRPSELSETAQEFDRRFRDALADDLDLPTALVVLEEVRSARDVADGEKYTLLASWDQVLGLDLERLAREGFEIPQEIRALVSERDEARQAKDYARSDAIRNRLTAMGWEVMDTPEGTKVRPKLD
jgi:cysteinyl-tRNA synthetase